MRCVNGRFQPFNPLFRRWIGSSRGSAYTTAPVRKWPWAGWTMAFDACGSSRGPAADFMRASGTGAPAHPGQPGRCVRVPSDAPHLWRTYPRRKHGASNAFICSVRAHTTILISTRSSHLRAAVRPLRPHGSETGRQPQRGAQHACRARQRPYGCAHHIHADAVPVF